MNQCKKLKEVFVVLHTKKVAVQIPSDFDGERASDLTVDLNIPEVSFSGDWILIPKKYLITFREALQGNGIPYKAIVLVDNVSKETRQHSTDRNYSISLKDIVDSFQADRII